MLSFFLQYVQKAKAIRALHLLWYRSRKSSRPCAFLLATRNVISCRFNMHRSTFVCSLQVQYLPGPAPSRCRRALGAGRFPYPVGKVQSSGHRKKSNSMTSMAMPLNIILERHPPAFPGPILSCPDQNKEKPCALLSGRLQLLRFQVSFNLLSSSTGVQELLLHAFRERAELLKPSIIPFELMGTFSLA
jgi:hypothetical protein